MKHLPEKIHFETLLKGVNRLDPLKTKSASTGVECVSPSGSRVGVWKQQEPLF